MPSLFQDQMNSLFSGQSEISADLKLSIDGGETPIDAMKVRTRDTLAFTASVTGKLLTQSGSWYQLLSWPGFKYHTTSNY